MKEEETIFGFNITGPSDNAELLWEVEGATPVR